MKVWQRQQNDSITVIYYKKDEIALHHRVFRDLPKGPGGRFILPDEFRENNLILVVMEGEVKILNKLGDRMFEQAKQAMSDCMDTLDPEKHQSEASQADPAHKQ